MQMKPEAAILAMDRAGEVVAALPAGTRDALYPGYVRWGSTADYRRLLENVAATQPTQQKGNDHE